MKRHALFLSLLIAALLVSCEKNKKKPLSEFKITRTAFRDVLIIDGYVEPISFQTVACPQFWDCTVKTIVEDGKYVNAGDIVCELEDKNTIQQYSNTKLQLANAEAEMEKNKAELQMQYAVMEAQVKSNEVETAIGALDSLQLKYSSENQRKIRELELKKTRIEKEKLRKKFESLKIIQQTEVRKMEMQAMQLKNMLLYSEQKMAEQSLKAPLSGMAIVGKSWSTGKKVNVGDRLWANMPIITIPQSDKMKVKIFTSEGNFKRISENDSVFYTFDAMPGNKGYGKISRKISQGKPVKQNSSVKIFEIEASLDSVLSIPKPGFTCKCEIALKIIRDTLVAPQIAVFERDSMKVVYVVRKNGYELREVATGISSPKDVIIRKGLKHNETISLSEPPKELITHRTIFKKPVKKEPAGKTKS